MTSTATQEKLVELIESAIRGIQTHEAGMHEGQRTAAWHAEKAATKRTIVSELCDLLEVAGGTVDRFDDGTVMSVRVTTPDAASA